MHAQHAQPQRVMLVKRSLAHQRGGHRNLEIFRQLQHLAVGIGGDRATSHIQQGPLALANQPQGVVDLAGVALNGGLVAGQIDLARLHRHIVKLRQANVFGNIDQHRAGATGLGNIKRLRHHLRNLVGPAGYVGMLYQGQGNAKNIGFLKRVAADRMAGHLAGDHHHGHRVHLGGGNAGDQVGGPRARGAKANPNFARGAGVAVSSVGTPLLVAH